MVSELILNKILSDVLPSLSGSTSESDMLGKLSSSIESVFGINKVNAISAPKLRAANSLFDYVSNTKRAYTDNQLSEYSAFPELIEYKNKGYRSCSLFPIAVNGKVLTFLEMLSEQENKFTDDMLDGITFAAYLAGFALMYKTENGKNVRLASYFDAAFSSPSPQMLVSKDGNVVKINKAAIKELGVSQQTKSISEIGVGIDKVAQSASKHAGFRQEAGNRSLYTVYAESVSDNLFHIFFKNVTEPAVLSGLSAAMGVTDYICAFMTDGSMSIFDLRGNTKRTFGYPEELIYGKNIQDFIDNDKKAEVIKKAEGLKEGDSFYITLDLKMGDSGVMHTHSVFLKQFYGYLIVSIKANAEKYAKDAEEMISDFISTTSDIIFNVDALGYITSCNLSVETVLGYKKEEIVGRELRALYTDAGILDRDIAYIKNGGKIDGTYVNLLMKDGNPIPATHSMRLLKKEDNSTEYLVAIKELRTKRAMEEYEANIRKQESDMKGLKSTSELKSQFIYNISHELKTPLTAIKGFSRLLYDGGYGTLNDEQKGFVKTILDESDRLTLIIQQVLDATKLEANKVKLDLKEVDLKEMQNNPSIKALEESAREKGIEFSWTVDFDVPSIIADPNRLIQVFVNLIGNSIKFTEKGSIKVHVKKKSRKMIECAVSDTGIGISDEDKRKIFKKFYQAQKKELVKQDGAGTGLGLSITKDIILLHHGKITFESQLGKGSTFSFILPIKAKEQKKEQKA